jgi:hypothetical protein
MNRTFVAVASVALFLMLFNVGYVFHDLLMGPWLHEREAAIARDEFIIPLIAVAFAAYAVVLGYLFPIYRNYYAGSPLMPTAIRFGILMGFVWDALQGGIIEVATFNMPFSVFLVDSGYHVLIEGTIAGVVLGLVARRWPPLAGRDSRAA